MNSIKTLAIIIALSLLASFLATNTIGRQLALGDNSHNKFKIDQHANQKNKCKSSNELKNSDKNNKDSAGNDLQCANLAFNIVCLPNSVCILPNEQAPFRLATPT